MMRGNNPSWYALYTMPRAEKKVKERLIAEGITTFLPTIKTLRQWSDRKKMVEQPLIPSYIFVKIENKDYETVRRVPGVVNFVYYLGKPAVIRDKEIAALKEFIGQSSHDTIEFEINDKVQINSGAFSGRTGIVKKIGKKQIFLYIEELGLILKAEQSKNSFIKA